MEEVDIATDAARVWMSIDVRSRASSDAGRNSQREGEKKVEREDADEGFACTTDTF